MSRFSLIEVTGLGWNGRTRRTRNKVSGRRGFHGSHRTSRDRRRLKEKLFVSSLASQNVYLVKSIRSRSNDYIPEVPPSREIKRVFEIRKSRDF